MGTKMETTALVEIPEWGSVVDPSWDRAKALTATICQGATSVVALGLELQALRKQWFAQGGEGRFGKGSENTKSPMFHGSTQGASNREKGWQEKVMEELGISHDTANRLIERAEVVCRLNEVSRGETVIYRDSRNEKATVRPNAKMQDLAGRILTEVLAGTINPKRAWAGVVGEGTRAHGEGPNRAPVDYAAVLKRALRSLAASLEHWPDLKPAERAEIEDLWASVRKGMPGTWRA